MDSKLKTVAIIDNYPSNIQDYKTVFKRIESSHEKWNFKIKSAKSYDEGLTLLDNMESKAEKIDLVFLDLHISTSREVHFKGEKIGLNIRRRFPGTKIMVKADSTNNYHIYSIHRSLKPEGFLIMMDVDMQDLFLAIIDVFNDPPFYSKSVLKSFWKYIGHNILLDKWDERLLFELSRGIKMKDLPEILPLSLNTIEKRKQNIKSRFGIEGSDNNELLKKAREYGFI